MRAPPAGHLRYELSRLGLADRSETTVYVVAHPRASTRVGVVCFASAPQRLDRWCMQQGRPEALVAGFFLRDPWRPLGEVRIGGRPVAHEPVAEPFGPLRGCLHIATDGTLRIAARAELPDAESRPVVTALTFDAR